MAEILLYSRYLKTNVRAMLAFYSRFRFSALRHHRHDTLHRLSNSIQIGPSTAELWRHSDYQDGDHQPPLISSRVTADHPRSANGDLSLILKFRIYSFVDIFMLRSLGLKLSTLCLKKVPTFKLCVTLSNLNRFSNFLHCWKAYEICYKTLRHFPPHLRDVVTLPWEIKNLIFLTHRALKGEANLPTSMDVHPRKSYQLQGASPPDFLTRGSGPPL